MDRDNHYEAAFEAFLRERRVGFVAVDETRRALFGDDGAAVKSPDLIVIHQPAGGLLVDIKGRRFPSGPGRLVWQNWCSADDLDGLDQWAARFGPAYRGVLAFVYHILPEVRLPEDAPDQWEWQGKRYLARAVAAGDYRAKMRVRSPRWKTVHLPTAAFRDLIRPFSAFLEPSPQPVQTPVPSP
jgi:hypothetical protein